MGVRVRPGASPRIEGQIRGIEGMVRDDRYCMLGLLDDHAHHCVLGAGTARERDEKTAELTAAVGRLVGRR